MFHWLCPVVPVPLIIAIDPEGSRQFILSLHKADARHHVAKTTP